MKNVNYNYIPTWLYNLKGLICREYASSVLGLSTFPDNYVILDSTFIPYDMNFKIGKINHVDKLDLNYCDEVKEGLYITNEERTIIDMILYNSEYKIVEQSILSYISNHGNFEGILEMARYYDCEKQALQRIVDANL